VRNKVREFGLPPRGNYRNLPANNLANHDLVNNDLRNHHLQKPKEQPCP